MKHPSRYLPLLTTTEVAALDKARAVVVQPIASVEQHGPHLPLLTDCLIVEALLERALARCAPDLEIWTLPLLAYGKSNEHNRFPGTISLRAETLMQVGHDLAASLARAGFRKLVLLNGHGGQPQLLELVARDIREATGLMVFPLLPYRLGLPAGLVSAEEARYGIHAGDAETSLLLALDESYVRRDQLRRPEMYVTRLFDGMRYLSLEAAVPTAWLTHDLAPNGVIGDPTAASREKGEAILDYLAERLAGVFGEIDRFRMPLE